MLAWAQRRTEVSRVTGRRHAAGPKRVRVPERVRVAVGGRLLPGWLRAVRGTIGERHVARRRIGHPAIEDPAAAAAALGRFNARRTGSSRRIERLLALTEPTSFPAGEITDQGYLDQGAVLERRAQFVAALHARSPGPEIIQPVPPAGQLSGGRP